MTTTDAWAATLNPVQFTVAGEPQSKSRARVTFKNGRATAYTPKQTARAEQVIARAYRDAGGVTEPSATATFGLRLRFNCGTRQRRDLDNMTKLVLDALNRVAFADDSQVTELTAGLIRGIGPDAASTVVEVYETDPALAGYLAELKPCALCSSPIRVFPSTRGRIYCSTKCQGLAKRARPPITCEHCGTEFLGAANRRFCSRACSAAASHAQICCGTCGATFTAKRAFQRRFCSVTCYRASRRSA